ncbi:glycosyltransferase [Pseudescherichia sp.]|uniref:glycosyltransferase family 32 protein n=1 Tax=Pseudescherichia sp. TaxID=2055881 RepID=UPI0028A2DC77|nr:glycosyltransferase [Pseudescherichia sp.]
MKIPKTIHIVWIGDESKTPRQMIETWKKHNPGWKVVVWGNAALKKTRWINQKHINAMIHAGKMCGAADIMRYEILFNHGGFAVDADSICIRPLEEWLFDSQVCASMENEIVRPGLIANGYLASEPQAALMAEMIMGLTEKKTVLDTQPWQVTGPKYLTDTVRALRYANISCWPSHYFIPEHFTGQKYLGHGHIFAYQVWGTTRNINDRLAGLAF